MDEPLTKRILISGLTPTITQDDLSRRLGSFGSVTALDGLGALDALGQPRKFAYATLATSKGKLAKCAQLFLSISSYLTHSAMSHLISTLRTFCSIFVLPPFLLLRL